MFAGAQFLVTLGGIVAVCRSFGLLPVLSAAWGCPTACERNSTWSRGTQCRAPTQVLPAQCLPKWTQNKPSSFSILSPELPP